MGSATWLGLARPARHHDDVRFSSLTATATMSETTLQFTCPSCDAVLMISTSLRGQKVTCPKCANISIMPVASPAIGAAAGTAIDIGFGVSTKRTPGVSYPQSPGQPGPVVGFRCPYCQSSAPPEIKRRISTAGWVVFVVLLIACFPLSIIGLFIKEDYRVCSSCGIKLG